MLHTGLSGRVTRAVWATLEDAGHHYDHDNHDHQIWRRKGEERVQALFYHFLLWTLPSSLGIPPVPLLTKVLTPGGDEVMHLW